METSYSYDIQDILVKIESNSNATELTYIIKVICNLN